MCVFVWI